MKPESEFFIGWQEKAPPVFAKAVRRFLIALFIIVPGLAVLLVWQQKGFNNGNFEYGQLTTVQGELIRQPVPFLRIAVRDSARHTVHFERFLLIGLNKRGAEATLAQWESKQGALAGKRLTIRGTQIKYGSHVALELTEGAGALLNVSKPSQPMPAPVNAGTVVAEGEITDPKCFLGVMKPGDGRPHRSCAVRCIVGGIPPFLWSANDGQPQGYLLVGAENTPLNTQISDYVGRYVQIRGKLEKADNWLILRVDLPIKVLQQRPDVSQQIALCR